MADHNSIYSFMVQEIRYLRDCILQNKEIDIQHSHPEALIKANYLAAKFVNDPTSDWYDPDLAFNLFQNCGEYLPALKELLPMYISASLDDEGNIYDPHAFALAHHTAASIHAQELNNLEANTFLQREKTYGKSIKITEQFNTIVGQPLKSLVFFTGITKQMHQTALFDRKNTQNEKHTKDRAHAQQEWDQNYGLTTTK